jgi:hypothetical protein
MLCHSATLSDFPSVHTEYTSQSSLLLRLNWWMSGVTQTIWAQSPPLAHFFLGPKSPRPIWNLHRGPGPERHMFKLITCGNPIRFPSPILYISLSNTSWKHRVPSPWYHVLLYPNHQRPAGKKASVLWEKWMRRQQRVGEDDALHEPWYINHILTPAGVRVSCNFHRLGFRHRSTLLQPAAAVPCSHSNQPREHESFSTLQFHDLTRWFMF